MRIAVCGTKGGSGKSTLAGLLALGLANAGRVVAVKDSDPQGTLTAWLTTLDEPKAKEKDGWILLGFQSCMVAKICKSVFTSVV